MDIRHFTTKTKLLLKCLCHKNQFSLLIAKELNFFDTNLVVFFLITIKVIVAFPLGKILESLPLWDRNLYVPLCIEVLGHGQHRAEPIIVIAIAIITIEIEQTGIRTIP